MSPKVAVRRPPLPLAFAVIVLLISALLVGACSANPASEEGGETGNLGSQEQALGSEDSEESGGDEMPLIAFVCPPEMISYKLQLGHEFDFSPNRETDLMQVKGHTSPDAWCLVEVHGTQVRAEDCIIDYDFSGFVQTDEGKCDISGSSTALISIEGECIQGVPGSSEAGTAEIYLVITETGDPDATGGGALNCPGYSGPYIGFYPPSFFVATFNIASGPMSDTDDGPDLTGQFEYVKTYTLIPPPSP